MGINDTKCVFNQPIQGTFSRRMRPTALTFSRSMDEVLDWGSGSGEFLLECAASLIKADGTVTEQEAHFCGAIDGWLQSEGRASADRSEPLIVIDPLGLRAAGEKH